MEQTMIRTLTTDDLNGVCELCSEDLGYPCDLALVSEKTAGLDPSREAVFVATVNSSVVGFIHVEKYNVLYFETMANILGLAVKAEHQGNGIGRMLIAAAEDWAAANGIRIMRLNSGSSRTAAHGFYRHLGYVSEKTQLHFTKELR